jgi:hypothetical protein
MQQSFNFDFLEEYVFAFLTRFLCPGLRAQLFVKAYFQHPVGKQGATGHTWQTEEVPNMIIKIQVQVLKQVQPNVIILYTMHTNLNYFNRYVFLNLTCQAYIYTK